MKYISILRGINVGGHKKILMADLKILYKNLGFTDVVSYIQSGNVIFESDESNTQLITGSIEQAISKQYGFEVPVIIRTYDEINTAFENSPFGKFDLKTEGSKYFLTLLSDVPTKDNCEILMDYVKSPEQLIISGNHIYIHYPNGAGRTKLTNSFIENKLKVVATSRNWKTVVKLLELSKN